MAEATNRILRDACIQSPPAPPPPVPGIKLIRPRQAPGRKTQARDSVLFPEPRMQTVGFCGPSHWLPYHEGCLGSYHRFATYNGRDIFQQWRHNFEHAEEVPMCRYLFYTEGQWVITNSNPLTGGAAGKTFWRTTSRANRPEQIAGRWQVWSEAPGIWADADEECRLCPDPGPEKRMVRRRAHNEAYRLAQQFRALRLVTAAGCAGRYTLLEDPRFLPRCVWRNRDRANQFLYRTGDWRWCIGNSAAMKSGTSRDARYIARDAVPREVPLEFCDSICLLAFTDPVRTVAGQVYERASIEAWFRIGRATDPLTNLPLADLTLTPALDIVAELAAFREREKHDPTALPAGWRDGRADCDIAVRALTDPEKIELREEHARAEAEALRREGRLSCLDIDVTSSSSRASIMSDARWDLGEACGKAIGSYWQVAGARRNGRGVWKQGLGKVFAAGKPGGEWVTSADIRLRPARFLYYNMRGEWVISDESVMKKESEHNVDDNPKKVGVHEQDAVGWLRVSSNAMTPDQITETWLFIKPGETLCGSYIPSRWLPARKVATKPVWD